MKACPKMIIELRKKWPKNRAVYVSCVSKDKGAVVMKACKAGCIGCGKCVKVCAFDAITVENNLAYIDPQKCKLCRKCVNECPTGAIRLVGMDRVETFPSAFRLTIRSRAISSRQGGDLEVGQMYKRGVAPRSRPADKEKRHRFFEAEA